MFKYWGIWIARKKIAIYGNHKTYFHTEKLKVNKYIRTNLQNVLPIIKILPYDKCLPVTLKKVFKTYYWTQLSHLIKWMDTVEKSMLLDKLTKCKLIK